MGSSSQVRYQEEYSGAIQRAQTIKPPIKPTIADSRGGFVSLEDLVLLRAFRQARAMAVVAAVRTA